MLRSNPFLLRLDSSWSGVTSIGPRVVAPSLPLTGPRPIAISLSWRSRALQSHINMHPAMQDVSGNPSFGIASRDVDPGAPDHCADLELVVELHGSGRDRYIVMWADDSGDVGEVERREMTVSGIAAEPAFRRAVAYVLQEADVVSNRAGLQRCSQPQLPFRTPGTSAPT
jgi:hypothetical protein